MRHPRAIFGLALLGAILWSGSGRAADDTIKIGVLTDQSSAYSMGGMGQGIPTAVRMAVQDFGGKVLGKTVTVLSADHQNKTDIGAEIARRWIDEDHIDGFVEVQNTSIVRAVVELAAKANRTVISTTAGSSDLTNQCIARRSSSIGSGTHTPCPRRRPPRWSRRAIRSGSSLTRITRLPSRWSGTQSNSSRISAAISRRLSCAAQQPRFFNGTSQGAEFRRPGPCHVGFRRRCRQSSETGDGVRHSAAYEGSRVIDDNCRCGRDRPPSGKGDDHRWTVLLGYDRSDSRVVEAL